MEWVLVLLGVLLGIIGAGLALFVLGFVAFIVALPFFLGWAKASAIASEFL